MNDHPQRRKLPLIAIIMVIASWRDASQISASALALRMPSIMDQQRHKSAFTAKQNHPTSYDPTPAFLGPLVLTNDDDEQGQGPFDARTRIRKYATDKGWFDDDTAASSSNTTTIVEPLSSQSSTKTILQALVRHFSLRDAPIDVKELAESMEFYLRIRKRMLATTGSIHKKTSTKIHVVDACSGHGFTGMLFTACNPHLNIRVTLVDATEPPAHAVLKQLMAELCPWMHNHTMGQQQISFVTASLQDYLSQRLLLEQQQQPSTPTMTTDEHTIVIATHACGTLTDHVLQDVAISALHADRIAVMPCCYTGTAMGRAPYGLQRALGVAWAADIARTYQLEEAGYHTDLATIPAEITPMNRILLAEKRPKERATTAKRKRKAKEHKPT